MRAGEIKAIQIIEGMDNSSMESKALTLEEVHQGSYEILKAFSKICDEQGWKWFLHYGTMLGAIRHKGFIPWDDDIDIMMPRPDYDQFKHYFMEKSESLYPLKLFDKETVKEYPHLLPRVSDQRYHLIFDNEVDYGIGLFMDVYPLDGVGNDKDTAIKLTRKTKRLASLCFLTSRKKYATDNTDSKLKMIIKFPAYLWARLMGSQHYINRINTLTQTFSYKDSKYVACAAWPSGKKYGRERDVFEKRVFDTTEMVRFEDGEFPVPIGYDEFLSTTYGDYMTPPDEAGKKTHHTYTAYRNSD